LVQLASVVSGTAKTMGTVVRRLEVAAIWLWTISAGAMASLVKKREAALRLAPLPPASGRVAPGRWARRKRSRGQSM
jgi:hypothetical protein